MPVSIFPKLAEAAFAVDAVEAVPHLFFPTKVILHQQKFKRGRGKITSE